MIKYSNPLSQIQDQFGARIITYYLKDVPRLSKIVGDYYRKIESVDIVPDSDSEFRYFGKHFILIFQTIYLLVILKKMTFPIF